MRIQNILISIGLIAILTACINTNGKIGSKSDLSNAEKDTLIYSSPRNLRVLDNYKGSRKVEVRSYKGMLELFNELNYTPEAWQVGIREVPRVYLPLIGNKWVSQSQEITVENKKQLFFRGLAPLILRSNELIMMDRNRLGEIKSSINKNKPISEKDNAWVVMLAGLYKVNASEDQQISSMLEELWKKVDIVPTSLALAQAAEESGWGTSRFAASGNAIYGQWTWGGNSIKPEKQRKELGNYGIAAYETLQESVSAYMLNLNTHNAYASLREKRAELRNKNQKITGILMAETLTKYSERGEEYVKGLKSMINSNRLSPADEAYLSNEPPIYLIPFAD